MMQDYSVLMLPLYLVLFIVQFLWFLAVSWRRGSDHIFSPFPGYTFLFSLYFLVGTLALDKPADSKQWAAYVFGLIGFSALSHPFVSRFFREGLAQISPSRSQIDSETESDYFYRSFNGYVLAGLWFLSMGITVFLWAKSGIPLLSSNVDEARVALVSNGYLGTLGTSIDVIALFSIIFVFSARKRVKDWRWWLAIAVILSFIIVAILSGSRSRIFKLAIPTVAAYHFIRRPIPVRWVLFGIPIGATIIGLLGYFRAFSRWGDYVVQGLPPSVSTDFVSLVAYYASIELKTAVEGFAIVLRTFPDSAAFTHGWLHLGPFLTPFQIKVPIPGNYFKELIGGTWAGVGLAATFLAPMYADFGMPGILCFSAVYGLLLGIMYRKTKVNSPYRYYRIATYSLLYYFMLSAIRSDFVSFDLIWFISLSYAIFVLRVRPSTSVQARDI